MKNLVLRLLTFSINILASLLGRVVRLGGVSDAVLVRAAMTMFSQARPARDFLDPVAGRESGGAVTAGFLRSVENVGGDISDIINFSSRMRDDWVRRMAGDIPPGARVLDAGAGECQYRALFSHTKYETQDFGGYKGSTEGLLAEEWKYGKIDYLCDITSIPVEDARFDVVLCTEVLEHVVDPVGTLKELTRVLRPGGKLLLSAPLGSGLHQQPHHYFGGFTPHFYTRHLGQCGYEHVQISPLGGLLRHVAQDCHRVGRVISARMQPVPEWTILDLMMNWLPRVLSSLDDAYFVEEFTVGYLVEATKARQDLGLSTVSQ